MKNYHKTNIDYLKSNPVAKQISIDTYRLFENEDVNDLLSKTNELLLSIFKKIVFDIASTKNRNPDSFRSKMEDIGNSSSVKGMLAKIKDHATDVELIDTGYSEIKKLYLESIDKLGDAIKRAVELDPSLEAKIIDKFIASGDKVQKTMDSIAREMEKALNESLMIGFHGRADRLRKILINLISDSKGKDAKNGYGRDWHRLFSTMEQKVKAMDLEKATVKESDRKMLAELEKKVDNLSQEYSQYKIKATELIMKKIAKDEELSKKFSDLSDILTDALDQVAKANTQEGIAEVKIREDLEEKEAKMNDRVFPLKIGDKDTDARLKGSGIIEALQKALINAYVPIKNLLSPRGGADGKFEAGTSVAIKTIQGALGNKNADGKFDKAMLDSVLKLDQVSKEDKDAIKDSLAKLRKFYSSIVESRSVLTSSNFMSMFESTYIDPDEIEEEIKKYAEELGPASSDDPGHAAKTEVALAEKLAKLLRTKGYNKNVESEDFLRDDGSLKGSYPHEFLSSWIEAVRGDRKNSYFFIEDEDGNGGLYTTKRTESNVNKPCNWTKYSEIAGDDEEDIDSFGKWYTSYYKNFAGIERESKVKLIDNVLDYNMRMAKNAGSDIEVSYDSVMDAIKSYKEDIWSGYLSPSGFNDIYQAIKAIAGSKINPENLDGDELRFIYNVCIMLSYLITYDAKDKRWVCALDYAAEKFETQPDTMLKTIVKNKTFDKKGTLNKEKIPFLVSNIGNKDDSGIETIDFAEISNGMKDEIVDKIYETLKKIKLIINAKDKHLARIAISEVDDIKPSISKNIEIIRKNES